MGRIIHVEILKFFLLLFCPEQVLCGNEDVAVLSCVKIRPVVLWAILL
jgi:hypothetical protein